MGVTDATLRRIQDAIQSRRGLAIELQRELTAIPALAPENGGSGEWDKAMKLAQWLPRIGLPEAANHPAVDPRVPAGKRPNLVVTLAGQPQRGAGARPRERTLWLMTHLDVVPPGERSLWSADPYTMQVNGDTLVGRGVEDNQQSLVASLLAAASMLELGLEPAWTVRLLFVSDEETGSLYGIGHLLEHTELFSVGDAALVPDAGSADGGQVEIAEKSILWLKFTTQGRQCHASTPHKGINAFVAASHLVVRLGELASVYPVSDPLFDPPASTFTPTRKEANVPNVNTMPGEDVFYLDCRVLPRENLDGLMARMRSVAGTVEGDFGVKISIDTIQRASSPPTAANEPIVSALGDAIRRVYQVEPRIMGIGGGTVGAFLRRRGIPTAVWSRVEETAHQPDERCNIGNLLGDAAVMAAVMLG